MAEEFVPFPKIPRLRRGCVITEKIDGTNAQVHISDDGQLLSVGSRNRHITPQSDNYGFARWVHENLETVLKLGPGRHFGEWYGSGINRTYGLKEKRFALFNSARWNKDNLPPSIGVVPVLYDGDFSDEAVRQTLNALKFGGSVAVPGWMKPEGVVVYMKSSGHLYKVLADNDELPKGVTTHQERAVAAKL